MELLGISSGEAAILSSCLWDIIKQEAAEYLGPMAAMVCDEIFDELDPRTPADLEHAVDRVAIEIKNVAQKKMFKKQTLLRLNSDYSKDDNR